MIVNELAADKFTMKSAFVVPMFPSITAVSWIESVGDCACAAGARRAPNARISQGRNDVLIETVRCGTLPPDRQWLGRVAPPSLAESRE